MQGVLKLRMNELGHPRHGRSWEHRGRVRPGWSLPGSRNSPALPTDHQGPPEPTLLAPHFPSEPVPDFVASGGVASGGVACSDTAPSVPSPVSLRAYGPLVPPLHAPRYRVTRKKALQDAERTNGAATSRRLRGAFRNQPAGGSPAQGWAVAVGKARLDRGPGALRRRSAS